jgi:hypothetical protein
MFFIDEIKYIRYNEISLFPLHYTYSIFRVSVKVVGYRYQGIQI